jgi:Holliday junction resolvase RusA-like endonuclease
VRRDPPVARRGLTVTGAVDGIVTPLVNRQTLTFSNFPPPQMARALSPNGGSPHHLVRWRYTRRIHERTRINALAQHLVPMCGLVTVRPTWIYPVERRRDSDNLSGGGVLKALIDGLVKGKYLADDDLAHVRLLPAEVRVERYRRALVLEFEWSAESSAPASGLNMTSEDR